MDFLKLLFSTPYDRQVAQAKNNLERDLLEIDTRLKLGSLERALDEVNNKKKADKILKAFDSLLRQQCEGKHSIYFGNSFYDVEFKNGKLAGFKELGVDNGSVADELSKLQRLLDSGQLTDEEFAKLRKKLLG